MQSREEDKEGMRRMIGSCGFGTVVFLTDFGGVLDTGKESVPCKISGWNLQRCQMICMQDREEVYGCTGIKVMVRGMGRNGGKNCSGLMGKINGVLDTGTESVPCKTGR